MSAYTVPCILCGAPHGFDVTPGEPAHGPTYSCGGYPGSGPEVDWRKEGCTCSEHPVVDEGAYWDAMTDAAMEEAKNQYEDPRWSRYDTHPRV